MAVTAFTNSPDTLWVGFVEAVKKGTIRTWEFVDSTHFTHTSEQWSKKAFFKASTGSGSLTFNLVRPQSSSIATETYAEYHALLIRVLLAHFDRQFSNVIATAMPVSGDIIALG
ncbi:MAG: hypothetical protein HYV07_07755 [Deltaproteobacteria bacterium]|nr:hypothetical protein [Deltaproteobacteria bacterium]